VLLISQCLLGDSLAMLPALHALRHVAPHARLELISDGHAPGQIGASGILAGRGLVDRFHVLLARGSTSDRALNRLVLLSRLRQRHWDAGAVLLPPYPPLTAGLAARLDRYLALAGVRQRSRPTPEAHRRGHDGFLERVPHVSDRMLAQLSAAIGVPVPPPDQRSFLLPPLTDRAPARVAAQRVAAVAGSRRLRLVLAPGSNMPCKRWPVEYFGAVIRGLASVVPLSVLICGSQAEAGLCGALQPLVPDLPSCLVVGEPIAEVAEIMRLCDLYLGNDTGLMHLAAAVGTPCVAVFSSRDLPGAWEPYGPGHRVFRTPIACEGCLAHECPLGTTACIRSIRPDAVTAACQGVVADVLARRP